MNIQKKQMVAWGISLAIFLPLAFVYAHGANAAGSLDAMTENVKTIGETSGLEGSNRPLPELIGSIINVALGLLGIVLVALIIYAGYLWMMAQGNSGQVDTAKKIMVNAVIGMIILMASYAISNFIISSIMTATTS